MRGDARPLSSSSGASRGARVFGFLFFAVFLGMGSAFLYFSTAVPLAGIVSALRWQRASCEIFSSRVGEKSDSDGSTYRVEVEYRYFVDDQPFSGSRYQFSRMWSSAYSGKEAIVATLKPGTRVECWVNPANHAESVIRRGPTPDLLFGLLPLVFVAIGGVGMYAVVAKWNGVDRRADAKSAKATTAQATFVPAMRGTQSTALRPKAGRLVIVIALAIGAVFWNGMVSMFVVTLFSDRGPGGVFSWGLTLFMVPFALVGIVLAGFAVAQALALTNPRPHVTVSSPAVALGDEVRVEWRMDGRVSKLSRLTIVLEGREEATYQRGTDTSTDTHPFAVMPIATQEAPRIEARGTARVRIPAGSMHSFTAKRNRILWAIKVAGEVPRWPDSADDFPIAVAPRGVRAAGGVGTAETVSDPSGGDVYAATRLSVRPASGGTSRKPREAIEVVARWTLASAPKSLEARLLWFTRGKGTEDVGIVATERIETRESSGSRRVRFTVPEAPYSFSGRLITLTWAVELVADDEAARWEFVMAPDGREIVLGDAAGSRLMSASPVVS